MAETLFNVTVFKGYSDVFKRLEVSWGFFIRDKRLNLTISSTILLQSLSCAGE